MVLDFPEFVLRVCASEKMIVSKQIDVINIFFISMSLKYSDKILYTQMHCHLFTTSVAIVLQSKKPGTSSQAV